MSRANSPDSIEAELNAFLERIRRRINPNQEPARSWDECCNYPGEYPSDDEPKKFADEN